MLELTFTLQWTREKVMFKTFKRLFGKKQRSAKHRTVGPETLIEGPGITLKAQMYIRERNEVEQRIWELNRKASDLKDADLNAAIACLAEAQPLRPTVPTEYGVLEYLRLPLFLQKAGRMPEAMIEFGKLLKQFDRAHDLEVIYDKLRLAHQREKLHDRAVKYGALTLAYRYLHAGELAERELADRIDTVERCKSKAQRRKSSFWQEQYEKAKKELPEQMAQIDAERRERQEAVIEESEAILERLLKKAGKPELLDQVVSAFQAFLEQPSRQAAARLEKAMEALVEGG